MPPSSSRSLALPLAEVEIWQLRADLLARLRAFFAEQGFLEVETPLLSADTVVDRHLDPIAATLADDPRYPERGRRLWLQTSPELGMKRLLVRASRPIYQITRAFRNSEVGPLHNPEFTIVEWYWPGDDLRAGMTRLSQLCRRLFAGSRLFRFDESAENGPNGAAGCQWLSYAEAFQGGVQIDPHRATAGELAQRARQLGVAAPESLAADDRDGWLDLLLVERVQPELGRQAPTVLYDFPASQAALAKLHGDPPLAARFELYAQGVELANGYHELCDPGVLRTRQSQANRWRLADGKPALPEENHLLQAMDHGLPDCTGVALGLDRVLMLLAGRASVAEVLALPIDRA